MKKLAIWIIIFLILGLYLQGLQEPEKADLILTNGKVFTGLDEQPRFQAVAVKDGKILAVRTNEEIAEYAGSSTQVLDVGGKLADLVVLSRDLFAIPPSEILRTEVLYTILGGKIVYQK
jgi:predicted amidohydrolase YtcJ